MCVCVWLHNVFAILSDRLIYSYNIAQARAHFNLKMFCCGPYSRTSTQKYEVIAKLVFAALFDLETLDSHMYISL